MRQCCPRPSSPASFLNKHVPRILRNEIGCTRCLTCGSMSIGQIQQSMPRPTCRYTRAYRYLQEVGGAQDLPFGPRLCCVRYYLKAPGRLRGWIHSREGRLHPYRDVMIPTWRSFSSALLVIDTFLASLSIMVSIIVWIKLDRMETSWSFPLKWWS